MNKKKHYILLILFFLMSIENGNAQKKQLYPKNEFRAVWIATVVNIDWPKNSLDSIERQKADYIEILETYKKLNFNAVIVQIRSVGDAFFPTDLAPWSRYLTGREGLSPKPYFDTLEWMIEQAHHRGFEFHAWLNPYRATFDLKTELLSSTHDYYKHPEWMIKYGGKYYYNPALAEVQQHLTKVVEEVVKDYDIDAIHFDDYFYPYAVKGENFNDTASFIKQGNGLSLADWRRLNVTTFVKNISFTIKNIKPWVQFGISPFGVWRNKSDDPRGSDTQATTNYDDLFADPVDWMNNNWIDYIVPQLYWSIDHKTVAYSKLIKWWSENTPENTALYIGNSTYKIRADSDKKWNNPYEMSNQVDLSRSYSNVLGNAYFSAKWFVEKNKDIVKLLMDNQYKYPALPLAVPNLRKIVIDIPVINAIAKDSINCNFTIQHPLNTKVRYVVIYGAKKASKIDVNDATQIIDKINIDPDEDCIFLTLPASAFADIHSCAVTLIDFYGNESTATIQDLPIEPQIN